MQKPAEPAAGGRGGSGAGCVRQPSLRHAIILHRNAGGVHVEEKLSAPPT